VRPNLDEDFLGAQGVFHEKPIIAVLVVDAESVSAIGEINPCLGNVVRNESGQNRTAKQANVIPDVVPIARYRQVGEIPRPVVHPEIENFRHFSPFKFDGTQVPLPPLFGPNELTINESGL
jgi:hypothetical protein